MSFADSEKYEILSDQSALCVGMRRRFLFLIFLFVCFLLLFFWRLNDLSIPPDADFGKRDLRIKNK